ncbi:MAG TPA: NUDIX domain-containing protein [Pyrinomonadaceae bacterium]|nr:NUDIX domain-containing protein [Pyrinomonadaceae bacterium]
MKKEFGEKVKGAEYLQRPGSYAVIIETGRIGVLKASGYDTYFLIGGGIEAGESDAETLRREAGEEVGFQIEVGEKAGEAIEYFYSEREKKYVAKECRFYRVRLIKETEEKGKHQLAWITTEELDRMHHESYRWIIEEEL